MPTRGATAAFVADVIADAVKALTRGGAPAVVVGARLAEHVRAPVYALGRFDVSRGAASVRIWPEALDYEMTIDCVRLSSAMHPALDPWLGGVTSVACVSRLQREESTVWRKSDAYAMLECQLGCTDLLGIRLNTDTDSVEVLGIARAWNFTDSEIALAAVLQAPTSALHHHADQISQWRRGYRDGPGVNERVLKAGLTLREVEVLQLLSEGLLASTIGDRLAISTRTVHRHLSNIYAKLGTHDRLSTVMVATSQHLIPGPEHLRSRSETDAMRTHSEGYVGV